MSILVSFIRFSFNTEFILSCAFILLGLFGLCLLGINLCNIIDYMRITFTLESALFSPPFTLG